MLLLKLQTMQKKIVSILYTAKILKLIKINMFYLFKN